MTRIQDIHYFVYCNGFYFTNKLYPVEIGISEMKNYQSTSLIPVDLADLFETINDRTRNVHLIKNVHGIENVYLHRYYCDENDEGYGIKYKNLPSTMKTLFPKRTIFGVKGVEQKKMLESVLLLSSVVNNDDEQEDKKYTILDIEEEFGYIMRIDTYLKIAPTLHKGFHENPFVNAYAVKIAFNYAEFLRDRMKFGDVVDSVNFIGNTNWGEIQENDQQQQQQQHVDVVEENNFPGPSLNWRNQREDDDEIQIIESKKLPPVVENNFLIPPRRQQQQQQGFVGPAESNKRYFYATNCDDMY